MNQGEIKGDFFEKIDTKEKAYWLGFLYADGCVYNYKRVNGKEYKRIRIGLHKRDEFIIDRFLKAINKNNITKFYPKNTNIVAIYIANKQITQDLIRYGCVERKSKIIEFPDFKKEEYNLAFLLGYYDGDGRKNSTRINSGSLKFLNQIKDKYKLKFVISTKIGGGVINGRKIEGISYEMTLGVNLFNAMMDNYKYSVPKNRRRFLTPKEVAKKRKKRRRNR